MTDRQKVDALVAGGGIAGLTATAAFASRGLNVMCVDPIPPKSASTDLRSTAFFMPSVNLFRKIGVWDALAPFASPLSIMRIADAGGVSNEIREIVDFDSADIGQTTFGYNIPNRIIRDVLMTQIEASSALLNAPQKVKRIVPRNGSVLVNLENGDQIEATLVVAADGRNSLIREQSNIDVQRWQYGQKGLVFNVATEHPHENISTEIHRTGGPFTLVPLPNTDGKHMCAIVWMETGPEAERINQLSPSEFANAVNDRSCNILGKLEPVGNRSIWPIIAQRADRLNAERVALIAESAHVIPPIGAQGLNMSLADLDCLLGLVESASDIGAVEVLQTYHNRRWREMAARVKGVDLLNRAAMSNAQLLRDLRVTGLRTLYGITPVRRAVMKTGLGA